MNFHLFQARYWAMFAFLLAFIIAACSENTPTEVPSGNTTVNGMVKDPGGLTIPNAIVEIINSASTRIAADTTDDDGAFLLAKLPDDLKGLQLRISHSDFRVAAQELSAAIALAGGPTGISFKLDANDSSCGSIVVTVVDDSTGAAITGADVKISRGESLRTKTQTDSNGVATFGSLPAATYALRVYKAGYRVLEQTLTLGECDTLLVTAELLRSEGDKPQTKDSCCNGVLTILPKDSATGLVISGAEVRINKTGAEGRKVISTGDGGIFREVCAGNYEVRIAREGYRVVEFSTTMGCNDTVTVERMLVKNPEENDSCCNGAITVTVSDSASGSALSGAMVKAWKDGKLVKYETTGSNGTVTLGALCAGRYSLSILRDGYKGIEFVAELDCNDTVITTRTIRTNGTTGGGDTCCRGSITLVVRDSATNNVIPNAAVKLTKAGAVVRTGKTNSNGEVVLNELCDAEYGLFIEREGYTKKVFELEVGCNQAIEETILLGKPSKPSTDSCCTASLSVRTKSEGAWLNGVTVTIKKGGVVIAEGTTAGEGSLILEQLCGYTSYAVTFSKTGYKSQTFEISYGECKRLDKSVVMVKE